ncbi:PH domain-containing protein [Rhodothermus marinus]|uniref:PH domain-containing protein n=1 Tax=Rhodothermus marinus TaxID=29549 RepID=UPI0037CA769E
MTIVFRPKVDRWLAILLVGAFLSPWMLAGWLTYRGDEEIALVLVLVGGMDLLLARALLWPMRYEITPEAVIVRAGLVRLRVPYSRIQRIVAHHPLRDLSLRALSFGLSLREALRIEYGRMRRPNWLVIAPEDADAFLEAVARHDPALHRTGPRELVRIQKENGHEAAKAVHARRLFGDHGA